MSFCVFCGSEQILVPLASFDPRTGERETAGKCPNKSCSQQCMYSGGHRFGVFSDTCKKCGCYSM